MIFCGQCGLQLGPNDVRCPRCGAKVDVGDVTVEELHSNDATIASPLPTASYADAPPVAPYTPPQPQPKLVLRPNTPYDQPAGYDATSRVDPPDYPAYPTRGASYPGFVYPAGTAGAGQFEQREAAAATQRAKGRTASLVIILLGLLLVLSAMVLFALQHNGIINLFGGGTASTNPTPTPTTAATATLTPADQGQAVIRQLYKDVNSKEYRAAYDLWKPNAEKQTFTDFKNGYAHTRHTDLAISDARVLSDGTVKVSVSLIATEDASGGKTQQSRYQGYYIVQQQPDGKWLIESGMLQKI